MRFILSACCILGSFICAAQSDIWKHEMKVKVGIIDYNVIRNGNGLYFIERREIPNAQQNSVGMRRSYINISKLDTAFKEAWSKEYFLQLAEYDVITVLPANGTLVIFLGRYNKKIKSYTIDIAEIDDKKGNIPKESQFTRVATYPRGERREDFFDVSVTAVQKGFLLVSDISDKKSVTHAVTLLSPDLKTISNSIINFPSQPLFYALQEVHIYKGKLLVLGRSYQGSFNPDGRKTLRLEKHILSVYNVTGAAEGEIPLGASTITTAKIVEKDDSLLFAGLYNTYTMREVPDGVITAVIDPVKRQLNIVSDKKIPVGMFATAYLGDKDTSELYKKLPLFSLKNRRRFADSNSWIEMRSIDINPVDRSLMIAAEIIQLDEYDEYVYGNSAFGLAGAALPSGQVLTIYEYKTKDLVLINADSKGNVDWVNVIPKNQQETFETTKPLGGMHSSYKAAYKDGKYIIMYNDSRLNTGAVDYKVPVNVVWDFKNQSSLYKLSINTRSGTIEKQQLTDTDNGQALLIPVKSVIDTGVFIIPARAVRPLARDIFKFAVVGL